MDSIELLLAESMLEMAIDATMDDEMDGCMDHYIAKEQESIF